VVSLSEKDVFSAIDLRGMIPVMAAALKAYSSERVWVPERVRVQYGPPETTLLLMTASSEALNLTIVKCLTLLPANPQKGIAAIQGELTAYIRETGTPTHHVNAEAVTLLRTAACCALATDLRAAKNAETIAIFGTGPQACAQLMAAREVRAIKKALLYSRSIERAVETAAVWSAMFKIPVIIGIKEDLRYADVICTATDAKYPLFDTADVKEGVHINAIGSYSPSMRELPVDLIRNSDVLVDAARFCASGAGELIDAFGTQVEENVQEIGRELDEPHRRNEKRYSVFKSVGNASQDLYAVDAILKRLDLRH